MKPMISITTNTLGMIIVIRSPRSRTWLFNICLGLPLLDLWDATQARAKRFAMPLAMGMVILCLMACETPTAIPTATDSNVVTDRSMISTRYVREESTSVSCWYPTQADPQKDSLLVGKTRYTISTRSRYRVALVESSVLDAIVEGPVTETNWAIYRDTKTDSVYIFNQCKGAN